MKVILKAATTVFQPDKGHINSGLPLLLYSTRAQDSLD